ncbi:MAG TPA: methyltransferase [Rhodospirillaceae bacterium]|nr:MAG: hypothetical protein A2018_02045 [Alphaproteobacteria bacterium GWF2_58_20]HAU29570.1 methyltransferase [Rhodospirillaceae bacterium]
MTTGKTTQDRFLDGKILLRQPVKGYRAGIDPVFLAAAVPAQAGERVLDMGCGVGAALLCLAARVPGCLGAGLEIQPDMAALAQENVAANSCAEGFAVWEGDVGHPPAALLQQKFGHVMANPPYFEEDKASASPVAAKVVAHVLGAEGLAAWVQLAARVLSPRGTLTLVYPASRLADILSAMNKPFGEIRIFPLWPHAGEAAIRVLVQGKLGSKAPMQVLAGMVLHDAGGSCTQQAGRVLREGTSIAALAEKNGKG